MKFIRSRATCQGGARGLLNTVRTLTNHGVIALTEGAWATGCSHNGRNSTPYGRYTKTHFLSSAPLPDNGTNVRRPSTVSIPVMARAINAASAAMSLRTARLSTLILCLSQLFAPLVKALPIVQRAVHAFEDENLPKDPADASLWIYLGTAALLVLGGGAFAGL